MPDLSLGFVPPAAAAAELPCPCLDLSQPDPVVPPSVVISPTLPFSVDGGDVGGSTCDSSELAGKSVGSLLGIVCPRLSTLTSVPTLLNNVLTRDLRLQVLSTQAEVWADDEIRFFLKQLVEGGPAEQQLMWWDPLALSSVVRFSNFNLLQELVAGVPPCATVVSACLIEKHWYAVCWRCSPSEVSAFTAGHPCNMSLALQKVHMEFCTHRGCPHVPISFRSMPFVTDSCCVGNWISPTLGFWC